MPIRVDTYKSIPKKILPLFESVRDDLTKNNYIDKLARSGKFLSILQKLHNFLEENEVIAIHYTRSFRDSILSKGLILQNGNDRRNSFIKEHGHLFADAEISLIEHAYEEYFSHEQNKVRDGRIWFNYSTMALNDGGAERLLRNYGGEAVYMPLAELAGVREKIQRIGEPLIVKCKIKPSFINGFWDFPSALVWLSSYHIHINPNARFFDVDIYVTQDIPPEDIITVETVQPWL